MENQTKAAPVARKGLLLGTVLSISKNGKVVVSFTNDANDMEQFAINNPQKLAVEAGKKVIFTESIGNRAYKLDATGARIPKADGTGFELQNVDPYLQRNLQGVYDTVKAASAVITAGIKDKVELEAAKLEAQLEAQDMMKPLYAKYNVKSKEELLAAMF